MIKYHGSPLSGEAPEAMRFYRNRHALISFWRPDQLPIILEVCLSFILDSGTFSAWRKGVKIDFGKYIEWVRSFARHPRFSFAFIPDIIDGQEWANDALLDCWPEEIPGVPVYHLHEDLKRLERLQQRYSHIALGSSGRFKTPGTADWWHRMAEIMDILCDAEGRPKCRIHGLRMMDPAIFTRVPFTGADSANAPINAGSTKRFPYRPPSASVRAIMIADRIEAHNSPAVWDRRP